MDGTANIAPETPVLMENLTARMVEAVVAVEDYFAAAKAVAAETLAPAGKPDRKALDAHQHLAHGLAWTATYLETLRETARWARRLEDAGGFGEIEGLLSQILFSKYLADLVGGVALNQGEVIRPHEMGLLDEVEALFATPAVKALIVDGLTPAVMAAAAAHLPAALDRSTVEDTGLGEDDKMIRDQFHRFANEKVAPYAHEWHLKNDYIPMELVGEMGELGVFGLTIPEDFGGAGMGKTAMCVVSEELSRGYIGVGSLGTRSEIAAELILIGGADEQKQK